MRGVAAVLVAVLLMHPGCSRFREEEEPELLPATGANPVQIPLVFTPVTEADFKKRLQTLDTKPKEEFPAEWDKLSELDQKILDGILAHWESWMPAKKTDGTAPLISFEPLYEGLNEAQKKFLDRVRAIEPRQVEIPPAAEFIRIEGQEIKRQGKKEILGPQYLPADVHPPYEKMMKAMKQDLGKRLFVDSGYRSPAYQLYTFLYFMPKHHYSIQETREWVALPGHSEHGNPARQAIDFINEDGENGEEVAEYFERLPEYDWLVQNASRFGFELSYPRGTKGTTFEPWHWRFSVKRTADSVQKD